MRKLILRKARKACHRAESRSVVDRYYDPDTGQFLTVDPDVGETGQPYAYAGGDPANGSDPTGASFWGTLADTFDPWSQGNYFYQHPAVGQVAMIAISAAQLGLDPISDAVSSFSLGTSLAEEGEVAGVDASEMAASDDDFLSAEGEADDLITLYHGSVDNFSDISANGLDPEGGPTWVTTEEASAQNAIGPGRVLGTGQGVDSGVVSSTVSRSALEALDDPADVGGLTTPRTWPGFGGGGPYTEFVLRSARAIELSGMG
jgi:uncharacterized protein RhaS with RHS repeats